jgi:hypothetical protein
VCSECLEAWDVYAARYATKICEHDYKLRNFSEENTLRVLSFGM